MRTPDHLILYRNMSIALVAVINDTPEGAPAERISLRDGRYFPV